MDVYICGFSVSCVRVVFATCVCLVDVLDFVFVLFQSGAFRVVVATRTCFG